MKRRLVIELYDHTTVGEVADLVESLHAIGVFSIGYETDDPTMTLALTEHLERDYSVIVEPLD